MLKTYIETVAFIETVFNQAIQDNALGIMPCIGLHDTRVDFISDTVENSGKLSVVAVHHFDKAFITVSWGKITFYNTCQVFISEFHNLQVIAVALELTAKKHFDNVFTQNYTTIEGYDDPAEHISNLKINSFE